MSVAEGRRLRDEGMKKAEGSVPPEYRKAYEEEFRRRWIAGEWLRSDLIVAALEPTHGPCPAPHGIGPIFGKLKREYKLKDIGMTPMANTKAHARRTPTYVRFGRVTKKVLAQASA